MWVMEEEEESVLLEDDQELAEVPTSPVSFSLNSVVGIDNPKTMHLTGMLLDTGGCHD